MQFAYVVLNICYMIDQERTFRSLAIFCTCWYVLWHTLAPRGVAASGPEGAALNLRFFMLPDASPNAFALPGGFVFVHAGLLAFADSADEATESARAHRHY